MPRMLEPAEPSAALGWSWAPASRSENEGRRSSSSLWRCWSAESRLPPAVEKELPARAAKDIICGRFETILSDFLPGSLPRPRNRCRAEDRPREPADPGGGAGIGTGCLEEELAPAALPWSSSQSLGGEGCSGAAADLLALRLSCSAAFSQPIHGCLRASLALSRCVGHFLSSIEMRSLQERPTCSKDGLVPKSTTQRSVLRSTEATLGPSKGTLLARTKKSREPLLKQSTFAP
mmetsp:Transcript_25452/g.73002  ORF Transcript_25452/g.73002 Transcript_25452/m.73002 type:complete len:234 (-) Transcript_25452:1026-1727(-)